VLAAGSFINRFGSFVLPFLVLYLRDEGFPPATPAAAVAAYGVGKLLAAPSGGYLADRIGPRVATAASMFLGAGAMLALWQSTRLGDSAVVICALLAGWASELYRPSVSALISSSVSGLSNRVTAFGVYQLGANAGLALGPVVGGLLASYSFTPLFVGEAATSSIWGVMTLILLPRGGRLSARQRGSALSTMARDRRFVRFWIASLLVNIVLFQAVTTFPLWVLDNGHSTAVYGALLGLSAGAIVVFQLPLTHWTRHRAAWPIIAGGCVLAGVGFGMLSFGGGLALLAISVLIWSFCETLAWPVAGAWVTQHAPAGLVGRYAGARSLTFGFGLIIAPFFGNVLYDVHPTLLWLACFVVSTTAAGLLVAPVRSR
jgi:MFS family permease